MTSTLTSADLLESPLSPRVARFLAVRARTLGYTAALEPEDRVVQSMADASPVNWHLAHTTWFFEQFVLARFEPEYAPFDERFGFLFNSYYEAVGDRVARPERGMLTRPTGLDIERYRADVDARAARLLTDLEHGGADRARDAFEIVELGLQHEQQHQELLITDLKHAFSRNPLLPSVTGRHPADGPTDRALPAHRYVRFEGGLEWIGAPEESAGGDFHYDNEGPRHRAFVHPFELATRAVSAGEWLEFMEDGGYDDARLWLSAGWERVRRADDRWRAPLYWFQSDGRWCQFTASGVRPVDPNEPVCHVSYYEADAFATWSGARIPTEFEWEVAARQSPSPARGRFAESEDMHPAQLDVESDGVAITRMLGNVWEWTSSAYAAFPGFRTAEGALGEYNGKFMSGQFVLRGGSCATPESHIRPSYRNFFPPNARWQFSGVRLARDVRSSS